jgi:hypothetical protein
MSTIERAELLTDLYAARSRVGVIHDRISRGKILLVAFDCASACESLTEAITKLETQINFENEPARTATPLYNASAQGNAGTQNGTAPR